MNTKPSAEIARVDQREAAEESLLACAEKDALSAFVTMGQRGTLVIPAEIRRLLGLECGSTLFLTVEDGELRLESVPADPFERLAWAGKGLFSDDSDEFIRGLRDEWP